MAIKKYSEQIRLPRIGWIKCGKKNENGHPVALDHFVGPDVFHSAFGEKPTEIPCYLPYETIDDNFKENLKAYKAGGKLFCTSDGETAKRADGQGGMIEMPCPYQKCPYYEKKECAEVGVLNFVIPKISRTHVFQFSTKSFNSGLNLRSVLRLIHKNLGTIQYVPMVLKIQMQKATPFVKTKSGEIKQITTNVPVISLDIKLSDEQISQLVAHENVLMLSDGGIVVHQEKETVPNEVDAEFEDAPAEAPQETWPNDTVKKYMDLKNKLEGIDLIAKYMTVIDKETKEPRSPSLDQIKSWNSDKELAYLNSVIARIESDFPEVKNA